jgi:DNA-directed RNA polymerase subunit M/transcription elongation factor TFIIS
MSPVRTESETGAWKTSETATAVCAPPENSGTVFMSFLHQERDRFRTRLKCGRCGAEGHAEWEENSGVSSQGPMGTLIAISENFTHAEQHNVQGQPRILCKACGAQHSD